jgi:hypothetical protein
MTAFLKITGIKTPRTCVIYSKGCYKELLSIFRAFRFFFQFWLIFYVAKEKMSVIQITDRIMPKLTVIRIKLFLNRTNTSTVMLFMPVNFLV